MNLSWNTKIKLLQGLCFFGGPLVLIFNWNFEYLMLSIFASWVIVHLGVSIGLHRSFSHRSWEPRNKIILVILHFLSIINIVGSTITWTGTHRLHHRYSDTDKDPHRVSEQSRWSIIKTWFNYWPSHQVSLKIVKDLTRDTYHKFFHRHYFKIIIAYMVLLLVVDLNLFMYGFIVTTMISLHTISWITVGAHLFGHIDTDLKKDSAKNTYIMGLYMWGEGWHNNHHAKPWAYNFGWHWWQIDLGKWTIQLLGKPSSLRHSADIK
jgi:stearoyl-CoA desaturase (delta-9 desaturase)